MSNHYQSGFLFKQKDAFTYLSFYLIKRLQLSLFKTNESYDLYRIITKIIMLYIIMINIIKINISIIILIKIAFLYCNRQNSVVRYFCDASEYLLTIKGVFFYFGKNALSLLHPLVVVTLASRQFEAVHFSGV